ncbi:MAG: hypothetical protein A2488_01315 [Candidatus Magasanikbacteria bacterium RIFOXYC12_FULL_32_21b]|nr:MAG: hypothetical protein A2488_01315 [Candidatus Magasanikbacteria bacterium RIFOXYC12_FULL_32_21b]
MLSPIVLFVYNRLEHTRKTIEALQKNELAKDSELFVYSDGPKNEENIKKVNEVRKYINSIDGFKKVKIVEREINFGLARSIIAGVTDIVNKYGKIIVLEDDIVTSPYFLTFMNDALCLYENEEKVMHISGYFFPVENKNLPETFFYNQTSCWGWGTWSRSWNLLDHDVDSLLKKLKFIPKEIKKNFYYKNMISQLGANKVGKINTWGARWQASVLLNEGFCLHPKFSFVENIGNDGSGVHCNINDTFDVERFGKKIKVIKQNIKELETAKNLMNNFFIENRGSFFNRVYRFLFS